MAKKEKNSDENRMDRLWEEAAERSKAERETVDRLKEERNRARRIESQGDYQIPIAKRKEPKPLMPSPPKGGKRPKPPGEARPTPPVGTRPKPPGGRKPTTPPGTPPVSPTTPTTPPTGTTRKPPSTQAERNITSGRMAKLKIQAQFKRDMAQFGAEAAKAKRDKAFADLQKKQARPSIRTSN